MEIQFFHFPESGVVQEVLESRIRDCVHKFGLNIITVKVYFTELSLSEHQMKIDIRGAGHFEGIVHGVGVDHAHSFEKAIQKLENLLRKHSSKHKHQKGERDLDKFFDENAFDKYENSFISDFEDSESKKAK